MERKKKRRKKGKKKGRRRKKKKKGEKPWKIVAKSQGKFILLSFTCRATCDFSFF